MNVALPAITAGTRVALPPLPLWSQRVVGCVLLVLTAGLGFAQRDFAKLGVQVGQVWLFPLDVGLGICLIALVPQLVFWLRVAWNQNRWFLLLLVYLGIGFVYLLESLPAYGVDAIRDSAYVYYALYAIVTFLWVRGTERYRLLFIVLAAGVSLAALGNVRAAVFEDSGAAAQHRGIFGGVPAYGDGVLAFYSGAVFLASLAVMALAPRSPRPLLACVAALHWGNMILAQNRSVYLGVAAGILVLFALAPAPRWPVARLWAVTLLVLMGVPVLWSVALPDTRGAAHVRAAASALSSAAPAVAVVQESRAPEGAEPPVSELEPAPVNGPGSGALDDRGVDPTSHAGGSGPGSQPGSSFPAAPVSAPVPHDPQTLDSSREPGPVAPQPASGGAANGNQISVGMDITDATGQWRLQVWRRGLALFLSHLPLGQGFGRPVDLYVSAVPARETDFNLGLPHNTYLLSLIRQGMVGTIPLLVLLSTGFAMLVVRLRRLNTSHLPCALAVASVIAAGLVYGTFSLFLESPHLAALFWGAMGIGSGVVDGGRAQRVGSLPVAA